MKKLIRMAFLAALTAILIPVLMLTAVEALREPEPVKTAAESTMTAQPEQEQPPEAEPEGSWDAQQTVVLQTAEGRLELPLNEYLVGVLAGELPQSFEPAAITAQAVAARTFTLRQMADGKHGGWLCDEAACCQAWTECAEGEWRTMLEGAVAQTDGQVLCYEGELIEALFFSCSGGRTEAAVAVWGGDVPYLVSVDSPGEERAPRYCATVCCSAAAFRNTVLAQYPEAGLSGLPENWIGSAEYTDGGGVEWLKIGETAIPGTVLRRLFGLNSTCFTLRLEGDEFVFETLGFGHRVGLSQYGANAMAQAGADWEQILAHYYPGTKLTCLLVPEAV